MTVAGKKITVGRLRELVATVLEIDIAQVTEDALFYEDLEVDSLHKTEISALVKREFNVRINPENWAALNTIMDLMEALHDKGVVADE
jgi:acyl carrier protein